jgi:hypothetical protein
MRLGGFLALFVIFGLGRMAGKSRVARAVD